MRKGKNSKTIAGVILVDRLQDRVPFGQGGGEEGRRSEVIDPDAPRYTFDYANNAWRDDYEPTEPWRPQCEEDEHFADGEPT